MPDDNERGNDLQTEEGGALHAALNWLDDACGYLASWEDADPCDPIRKPLRTLVQRFVECTQDAAALAAGGHNDQGGALLRVAIENLWLVDCFTSQHPKARQLLTRWVEGERIKPVDVRKMLAEEMGENDEDMVRNHQEFLAAVYRELCDFIHPRPVGPSSESVRRGILVVLLTAMGSLPLFFYEFGVGAPRDFHSQANTLAALVTVELTMHLPEEIRREVADFALAMLEAAAESDENDD